MKKRTKTLLLFGPLGSALFIIIFLIEGATREGYSTFRFPISSLSIGELGWIQITNFIISGSLIFLFAFGLRNGLLPSKDSKWIPRLIGAAGLGLIGAGIFTSDPVFGYPMTAPLAIAQFTIHGHLHDFFSIFVFVCLPISCFKYQKRFTILNEQRWSLYSLLTAITMLITFVLAGIGFKQIIGLVEYAGVFQRLTIIIGFTWISAIAIYHLKNYKRKPIE